MTQSNKEIAEDMTAARMVMNYQKPAVLQKKIEHLDYIDWLFLVEPLEKEIDRLKEYERFVEAENSRLREALEKIKSDYSIHGTNSRWIAQQALDRGKEGGGR